MVYYGVLHLGRSLAVIWSHCSDEFQCVGLRQMQLYGHRRRPPKRKTMQ